MKFKKHVLGLVCLSGAFCSMAAFARHYLLPDDMHSRSLYDHGLYVGGAAGMFYNDSLRRLPEASERTSNSPISWTASAQFGYQFKWWGAVQFGYNWYQMQRNGRFGINELLQWNIYLALKGIVPIAGAFSGYIMIGPAYTYFKYTNGPEATIGSPMAALGLTYKLDENISFNLQVMEIANSLTRSKEVMKNNWTRLYRPTMRVTLGFNYLFPI